MVTILTIFFLCLTKVDLNDEREARSAQVPSGTYLLTEENRCWTSDGHQGVCSSLRSCYPGYQLTELNNFESLNELSIRGTCQFNKADGLQVILNITYNFSSLIYNIFIRHMECAVLIVEHILVQVSMETFSEVETRNSEVVPSLYFNQLDSLVGELKELKVVSQHIHPSLRFRSIHLLPKLQSMSVRLQPHPWRLLPKNLPQLNPGKLGRLRRLLRQPRLARRGNHGPL